MTQSLSMPYCGAPPTPQALWLHWNLDPILIVMLLLAGGAYAWGAGRAPAHIAVWRKRYFATGWLIGVLALVSPLCPLSVALFSARVGQHMLLTLAVAPLIILGRPARAYAALAPRLGAAALTGVLRSAPAAACLFAAALWFWQAPGPYAATFASPVVYWIMHLTVFGAALLLWSALIDPPRPGDPAALIAGLASALQMTFLGALITLSPHALYSPHLLTTASWGLSPLTDQRIGGLIMWAPGCSVFLVVTLWALAQGLRGGDPAPRHAAL